VLVVLALIAADRSRAWARSPWRVMRIPGSECAGLEGEERPVLAAAADGWAVLAWDAPHHTFIALKPPGASRFGAVRRVGHGGAAPLSAAIDGHGQAVVAWQSAAEDAIRAVRLGPRGIGPVVRLSPLGANFVPEEAPQVSLTGGGRAAVEWFMFQPAGAYVNLASPGHAFGAPQPIDELSSTIERVYTGFDASGDLHITWQDEGSLLGALWSARDGRQATQTLLALGGDLVKRPPLALDVGTLSSGAELAILSGEPGVWLSRQAPGGVFGPLLAPPAIERLSDAAVAPDGWALLAGSADRRDVLSVCRPGGGCARPEPGTWHEELRTLAIGDDGEYVVAWEGTRGADLSGELRARVGHGTRLGRASLLSKENEDEQVSSAVTAHGEILLTFETPHGVEIATRPGR
jgi:hypothetical protein